MRSIEMDGPESYPPTGEDLQMAWAVSRDLLGIADLGGRWRTINPAWQAALGWNEDELIGRTSGWLLHPQDVDETGRRWEALAAGRDVETFENRCLAKSGAYRTLSWRAVRHGDAVYTSARDVTDVHERANALSDQQDFARLALQAVGGVGAWTYEVSTDLFTCDAAVCDLYAIDVEQGMRGISREAFLANVLPDDREALRKTMAGGLLKEGDLELEYRLQHPSGVVRSVLSRGHTYFSDDGRPIRRTGVAIETTQRRQLEEQLRQSQKMEAVGQLTGGLAHDFNNLLTGITGSLELLQIRMAQGRTGELDRYLAAAQGAAKRAATLTHRLLAFSRRQTLDPKVIDVDRLVAGMEDLIRRTIGPEITLQPPIGTAAEVWPVLIDPGQLENALLNLCINARDAMPDGGDLSITTAHHWLDDAAALERDLVPGRYVSLCVRDTGCGMSEAVVARAFDPFFTTKPLGMGTGLGLSMVYGFAKQSHGQVRIDSVVGRGTEVCLYLPRHDGAADLREADGDRVAEVHAANDETILVVDDEPTVRMLVSDVLQDHGYRVIEAGDGNAALRVLQSGARVDLLITDVGLPGGLNGRQLSDAARVERPGLKVLFITGYAANAVLDQGHFVDGLQVLTKPFVVASLLDRVRGLTTDPS